MWLAKFLVLAPLVWAADSSFRVFHRIYEPGKPESPFVARGTLQIGQRLSFETAPSVAQDLREFADQFESLAGALYQVALELEYNEASPSGSWDAVSSVKVCHLHQATAETFLLHTTPTGEPYALDYFVTPTPHNGACAKKVKSSAPLLSFAANIVNLNSSVVIKSPNLPPLLELKAPQPVTPEGEPVVPVPEKTLFQKYWLYGVAILIALLLSGGGEEENAKK